MIMTPEEVDELLNPPLEITNIKLFDAGECIVCMDINSEIIFIPCGHKCVCINCYDVIK